MKLLTINIKITFCLLLLFSNSYLYSNDELVDSLQQTWNDETIEDSTRLKALDRLIWEKYLFTNPDTAFVLATIQREKSEALGLKKIQSWAINNQGVSKVIKGDYVEGMKYYKETLQLREQLEDHRGVAITLNNIGIVYERIGDLNNALEYHKRSLEIKKKLQDERGAAMSYGNIGSIYSDKEEYEKARENFQIALTKFIERSVFNQAATTLVNIANTFLNENHIDSCNYYLDSAEILFDRHDINSGLASYHNKRAKAFLFTNNVDKADFHAAKALSLARNSKDVHDEEGALSTLYKVYRGRDDKKAINYLEQKIKISDSLKNREITQQVIRQEIEYEYDKKAFEDSLKSLEKRRLFEAEVALKDEQIKRSNTLKVALFSGIAVLLIFGLIIYKRFRFSEQQNKVINKQKQLVEAKNLKISDSINYAKRLQNAILPSEAKIKNILPEYFIFFKPKDVVSGDFYFIEKVLDKGSEYVYFAAVDCTGHGVPGAMVSIVGANGLKRCILELGLRKPGEILDKLSELVAENFDQGEETIRDGMDMALCCIETKSNGDKRLHYAGANNPLWVLNSKRNNIPKSAKKFKESGGFEIKADKQAIGYTENIKPFTNHTFEVEEGDTFYTFSDGYADQFGGAHLPSSREGGKKYKSANFRRLLLKIQEEDMELQKERIQSEFYEWKGDLESVDDVCVIGVRL